MRRRFFYGYVILLLCFINLVFVRGAFGSFSVFYVALLEEFQWSHAVGATIMSLNSLVYALISPAVGYALDRLGPRVAVPLAGLLMGFGFMLSALSGTLWHLYASFGVLAAVGQSGLGFVTNNALISHWFVRRRATAMGLASSGQGLGMLIVVPLAQLLISQLGWREAFLILGAFVIVAIVPANALLQRRTPQEVGQLPDGDALASAESGIPARPVVDKYHWTVASALRSFPFWALTIGHVALGTGLFMIYTHFVAYLVQQGLDKLLAAFLLGLIGAMRIAGTLIWGYVSDRVGREQSYGVSILITLIGLGCILALNFQAPVWFAYVAAILYGVGHSAGNPTYGAVIGDIFGGKHVGTIFGFLEIGFGVGMALGSWSGGIAYDLTGSYRLAFALALVSFSISYLAIKSSAAWHRRQTRTPDRG
ncbi:MAG TPA: MFS transporter [Candidatus Acidoferrales bacterium]|nr:MFS transporter [Candidatus Acidoferrales bacterium]